MSAPAMSSGRARWAAFLLSLVGLFGAHRFYLGRYRSGLVMSLTILAGLFSPVWAGTGKMETLPAFAMLAPAGITTSASFGAPPEQAARRRAKMAIVSQRNGCTSFSRRSYGA